MALAQCVEPAVGGRIAQIRQSLCRCCHPRILARGCGRVRLLTAALMVAGPGQLRTGQDRPDQLPH